MKNIKYIEQNLIQIKYDLDTINTDLTSLKLLGFIIVLMFSVIIIYLAIAYDTSSHSTQTDYCHYRFGNNTYYNPNPLKAGSTRSCDAIDENGTMIVKYFMDKDYKNWKEINK